MLIVVDLGISSPNLILKKKLISNHHDKEQNNQKKNVLFFPIDKNLVENNKQVNNY
jgi:hypothetical protein